MPLPPQHEELLKRLQSMPDAEVFLQTDLSTSTISSLGAPGLMLARYELMRRESDKRDSREAKTLELAEDANRLAREANSVSCKAKEIAEREALAAEKAARWAKYATIIAMSAMICSITLAMFNAWITVKFGK